MTPEQLQTIVNRALAQHQSVQITDELLDAWADLFGDLEFEEVAAAVRTYNRRNHYPPKTSNIWEIVQHERNQQLMKNRTPR